MPCSRSSLSRIGPGSRSSLFWRAMGLPPGTLAPVRLAIANKVRDVIGHDLEDLKAFIEQRSA